VDAVNGSQLFTTNQTLAALASTVGSWNADLSSIQGSIGTLFDLRSQDRRDLKQGIASALALGSAPMPSGAGHISYVVNGATYRGAYAVGGELKYRLNTPSPMAVGVGFSYAGNKNNGVRVGASGEF